MNLIIKLILHILIFGSIFWVSGVFLDEQPRETSITKCYDENHNEMIGIECYSDKLINKPIPIFLMFVNILSLLTLMFGLLFIVIGHDFNEPSQKGKEKSK